MPDELYDLLCSEYEGVGEELKERFGVELGRLGVVVDFGVEKERDDVPPFPDDLGVENARLPDPKLLDLEPETDRLAACIGEIDAPKKNSINKNKDSTRLSLNHGCMINTTSPMNFLWIETSLHEPNFLLVAHRRVFDSAKSFAYA